MFFSIYLDPAPGEAMDLVQGVKDHNAKFHADGDNKAYLWRIVTGTRSGQFTWAQGPIKYAKFDQPLSDEHNADWEKNVAVHCTSVLSAKDITCFI